MKDLAKMLGVSVMTVSRAFKADTSVSEETRNKVLKTARELGYVLDSTAANLRTQSTVLCCCDHSFDQQRKLC